MSGEPPGEARDPRLPPGRHGLPRETVIANQRGRLLAAAGAAVVEVGYASLTVEDITKRASVSRVTFYELFERKTDCLLAAFDQAFDALLAAVAKACAAEPQWPQSVIAGVRAAVGFAVASPTEAGLLTVNAVGIEPALADRARRANEGLAEMLNVARSSSEYGDALPTLTEEALISGIGSVIAARLAVGEVAALTALAPHLAHLILTPYMGAPEAARLSLDTGISRG